MPVLPTTLRLKVQQISTACSFELSWGRGQQLSAPLPYPPLLTELYQQWRQVYLRFYSTLPTTEAIAPPPAANGSPPWRGRAVESGSLAPLPIDWQARLVEAEARLMYEFHRWLRSAELFDIRSQIEAQGKQAAALNQTVDLCLTCTPLALAKLPWETWELSNDLSASNIRLVRTPANIRAETTQSRRRSRRRARILAILGDETGLNFQVDREAVKALRSIADVSFEGWQPHQTPDQLKARVCQAIADDEGWDILFFAGHSNETDLTGGELAIAPQVSLHIRELAPYLTQAKDNGLKFAIFNSCSGMSIAEALIDLGLSQVAVMREPIHNRVAQEFLVQFLQQLAAFKDTHQSVLAACQFLKLEKNLTYPSAYLLPCLFRHPDAEKPFQMTPSGWKQWVKILLPTRTQAIAAGVLLTLSWLIPVQTTLLDRRLGVQALYRDVTRQVPQTAPSVVLVQIDDKSIRLSEMSNPNPIDRSYLAQLVDQVVARGGRVIGVDYLLDRKQPENDPILGASVRRAIANHQTWFVFGAIRTSTQEAGIGEATDIADPNWSLEGVINAFPNAVRLPSDTQMCYDYCPFAYLLALVHSGLHDSAAALPPPTLTQTAPLSTQLLDITLNQVPTDSTSYWIRQSRQLPLTNWAATFNQRWLRPMIDFSVPDHQTYQRIPAWTLLDSANPDRSDFSHQVVIIAPGGYGEAGVDQSLDNFPLPAAMAYWRSRSQPETPRLFTGAEAHAYMVHHLLTRTLVIPIPDSWMVATALLLGKGITEWIERRRAQYQWHRQERRATVWGLSGATLAYGAIALQVAVTANLVLPVVLPTAMFWVYILPALRNPPP